MSARRHDLCQIAGLTATSLPFHGSIRPTAATTVIPVGLWSRSRQMVLISTRTQRRPRLRPARDWGDIHHFQHRRNQRRDGFKTTDIGRLIRLTDDGTVSGDGGSSSGEHVHRGCGRCAGTVVSIAAETKWHWALGRNDRIPEYQHVLSATPLRGERD